MEKTKKIIAIGGGEIGRPGYKIETLGIDKEIINLSGKKKPKLLFIPTASFDSEGYEEVVKNYFGKKLGAKVDSLFLIKNKYKVNGEAREGSLGYTKKELENKIFNSDIIYVGGGNTLKMMSVWRKLGVDKLLIEAYKRGIVLSGVSAGAICWFSYGQSDARKSKNNKKPYINVSGLGLVNALFIPHYDFEKDRQGDLKERMKKMSGIALALDNCSAIEIVDDKYRIITTKKNAQAYKVYWKNKKYYKIKIEKTKNYLPIIDLLRK